MTPLPDGKSAPLKSSPTGLLMIYRLALLIVLSIIGVASSFAEEYPAIKKFYYRAGVYFTTPAAVCADERTRGGTSTTASCIDSIVSPEPVPQGATAATCRGSTGGTNCSVIGSAYVGWTCPGGGTLNTTTKMCTNATACVSPKVRDTATGLCVDPPGCPSHGTDYSSGIYDYGTNENAFQNTGCTSDGCVVVFSGTAPAYTRVVNSVTHYYAEGGYDYTGGNKGSCTPSLTPSPGALPNNSSAGQSTTTTTNPDGTTTQITNNTNTTCTGAGSCTTTTTTTTTTTGPNGPSTQTQQTQTTQGQSEYCAKNPADPVCKGGIGGVTDGNSDTDEDEFPDDYALEETQAKIEEHLSNIKDQLEADPSTFETDYDLTQHQETFDGVASGIQGWLEGFVTNDPSKSKQDGFLDAWDDFISPPSTAACTAVSGTVHGRATVFDYCSAAEKVRDVFGYVLWVLFAWYLFDLVTRKNP